MNRPVIYIENIWSTIRGLPHNAYYTLYDILSYDIPGSQFVIDKAKRAETPEEIKKYARYANWDGKKHLVKKIRNDENSAKFLSGLTHRVYSIIKENFNVAPKIVDLRKIPDRTLDLKWGKDFNPYEYQQEVVDECLRKTRGLIEISTGGGKTLVVTKIIQELGVAPFIFYVLTKDLMYQAKERLEEYIDGLEVGIIGDGECDIKEINVMTIQTAYRCYEKAKKNDEKENFVDLEEGDIKAIKSEKLDHLKKKKEITKLIENAKGLYLDEAHHAAANTCQKIIEHSKKAYYIYGGTATPDRADNATIMIEGIFGRKIGCISASMLIQMGFLVAPDIYYINLKTKKQRVKNYNEDYNKHILENEERNKHIIDIAKFMQNSNIPTLILVQRINHGEKLEKAIPNSVFVQGKSKKRQEVIEDMRAGRMNTMIATSLADEGLDIQRLQCLIMAGGGKSPIKCKQRVGRVIRKCEDEKKKKAIVYDFNDIGRWLPAHSKARKKILKEEKEFNLNNIDTLNFTKKKNIF